MILCVLIALSPIYGVYLNRFRASNKTFLKKIFDKADEGLINTILIDIKDDYGIISYRSKVKLANDVSAVSPSLDLDYLKEEAKKHKVKLIGRVAVFRDDRLSQFEDYAIGDKDSNSTRWVDSKNIGWVDPYNRKVWRYDVAVAKEVIEKGFDFVFFDYVRFPSDGELRRCVYSDDKDRYKTIESFIEYAKEKLGDFGICTFGYSIWRPLKREGQSLDVFKNIKALGPMLYPSHFSKDFRKDRCEERPYYIYFDSARRLKDSLPEVEIYPFIQGFDYLAKNFGPKYIRRQIEGALDAGADGFFIWHAAADYGSAWKALEQIGGRRIAFLIVRGSHKARLNHQSQYKDFRRFRIRIPFRKKNRIRPLYDTQSDILP